MSNPFEIISGLWKTKGESVLGIDIGSSSIKAVQLRRKSGQAVLETYGELALGPYAKVEVGRSTNLALDKLSEATADIIRESNITTKDCGIAIPLSSSLVSLIELPAAEGKQLDQMIPLEARKYIPVPITEVTLDWWVIPTSGNGLRGAGEETAGSLGSPPPPKVEVLVVAIHNDAILKYQDLVTRAGLAASFFEIEIFSAMRAVLREEAATVMIFDMGASSTKLYIVDRGIVRVSHAITRGSQDITLAVSRALNISVAEAENLKRDSGLSLTNSAVDIKQMMSATLNFILSEANRIRLNFERRSGRPIEDIILAGGGVNLKGFFEMAEAAFQTRVSLADPFGKLQAPAFLDPLLRSAGPEFAVAVGVALRRLEEVK